MGFTCTQASIGRRPSYFHVRQRTVSVTVRLKDVGHAGLTTDVYPANYMPLLRRWKKCLRPYIQTPKLTSMISFQRSPAPMETLTPWKQSWSQHCLYHQGRIQHSYQVPRRSV